MLPFLLAVALLVTLLLLVAGIIWAFTSGARPAQAWLRRGSISRTVRRETSDLDRRYEQLLRR